MPLAAYTVRAGILLTSEASTCTTGFSLRWSLLSNGQLQCQSHVQSTASVQHCLARSETLLVLVRCKSLLAHRLQPRTIPTSLLLLLLLLRVRLLPPPLLLLLQLVRALVLVQQ